MMFDEMDDLFGELEDTTGDQRAFLSLLSENLPETGFHFLHEGGELLASGAPASGAVAELIRDAAAAGGAARMLAVETGSLNRCAAIVTRPTTRPRAATAPTSVRSRT